MNLKKTLCALLALSMALMLSACGAGGQAGQSPSPKQSSTPAAGGETPAAQTYQIGIILKSADDPWTAWQGKEMQAEAEKNYPQFGLEVVDCNFDLNNQISAMENFITKGVDLIIIQPIDQNSVAYMVDQAFEAGIPVVAVTEVIDNEHSYNIRTDAYAEGFLLMNTMMEYLPEGAKVVELRGQLGMALSEARHQAIHDAVEKAGRTDITFLDSQTGEWMKDTAMNITEDWIQRYGGEISGVVSANDYMALGAVEAFKAAGTIDNVIICGVDCLPEACTAIKDGALTFTVVNDAPGSARLGLQTAWKLLQGETVEHEQILDSSVCDQNNVDEWIEVHKAIGNLS